MTLSTKFHQSMRNRRMARQLENGETIDVSDFKKPDGTYHLPKGFYQDGKDYCDAIMEEWIWSIGRDETGADFASTDARFYQNKHGFECIWLR